MEIPIVNKHCMDYLEYFRGPFCKYISLLTKKLAIHTIFFKILIIGRYLVPSANISLSKKG